MFDSLLTLSCPKLTSTKLAVIMLLFAENSDDHAVSGLKTGRCLTVEFLRGKIEEATELLFPNGNLKYSATINNLPSRTLKKSSQILLPRRAIGALGALTGLLLSTFSLPALAGTPHYWKPSRPPASNIPSDKTLGLSRGQVLNLVDGDFNLHYDTSIDGLPMSKGFTKDKQALLEVIGDPANVTRVMLGIVLPKGNDSIRITNTAVLLRVFINTAPGWREGNRWLFEAVGQVCKEPDHKTAEIIHDHRRYTLAYLQAGGVALAVTHE